MDTEDYIWYLDDENLLHSVGYRINNIFKNLDISPIKGSSHPLNCDTINDLAIPAGLVYMNAMAPQTTEKNTPSSLKLVADETPISEDLITKLLSLVKVKDNRKQTRKHRKKKSKNKTYKNN